MPECLHRQCVRPPGHAGPFSNSSPETVYMPQHVMLSIQDDSCRCREQGCCDSLPLLQCPWCAEHWPCFTLLAAAPYTYSANFLTQKVHVYSLFRGGARDRNHEEWETPVLIPSYTSNIVLQQGKAGADGIWQVQALSVHVADQSAEASLCNTVLVFNVCDRNHKKLQWFKGKMSLCHYSSIGITLGSLRFRVPAEARFLFDLLVHLFCFFFASPFLVTPFYHEEEHDRFSFAFRVARA